MLTATFVLASSAPARAADIPPVLKDDQSFRGRITYHGYVPTADGSREAASAQQLVAGTFTMSGSRWSLDERSDRASLHVSSDSSWIQRGSQTLVFDDPYDVGALGNSFLTVLADIGSGGVTRPPNGVAWSTHGGLLLYLQPGADELSGFVDMRSAQNISYTFDDWVTVNGLRLPQTILRLQSGVSGPSFAVTDYAVEWAAADSNGRPSLALQGSADSGADSTRIAARAIAFPWRSFDALFGLLLLGLCCVAWLRREAFTERLCARLASDPRGWRHEGSSAFVTPDGWLLFCGHSYKVGPSFYNRVTTVQSSPLFLRVSAREVPHVIVLARRFGRPSVFDWNRRGTDGNLKRASTRRASAGFSLIESLVATALFAIVVVGVVFPTLILLGSADSLAAQREEAMRLAANTLVDEQSALAYGTIVDGSSSQTINSLTVRVKVSPAAIPTAHSIDIEVLDARGRRITQLATMVGPAVPAPTGASPVPHP